MVFDSKPGDFAVGMMVVYASGGDTHHGAVEVGIVKSIHPDGCFVAYGTGDTCAKTPYRCLIPVGNTYALGALAERSRQLGFDVWGLAEGCEDWSR